MRVFYDDRAVKDPLGVSSTQTRRFTKILTQKISASLALGTASNYNSDQYGANHKIIYDGVAEAFAKILLDIADLDDDGGYSDLRVEFLSSKMTSLIFEEENTPEAEDDFTFKSLLVSTVEALVKGSSEGAILDLLSSSADGSRVEIGQPSNHVISVLTSVLSYTSFSEGHRHLVFAPDKGLGSTLSPLGLSWGDALHQHEIIDGVVQPFTNDAGVSHTHEIAYGLPSQVVRLQSNIRKLLNTTKPAHIKIGQVTSLLGEGVTPPSLQTITYRRNNPESTPAEYTQISSEDDYSSVDSFGDFAPLALTYGVSLQENMRKARGGTYENVIYGYAVSKKVRFFRALLAESDTILSRSVGYDGVVGAGVSWQNRRVVGLEEIRPEDGSYSWSAPRFSESGICSVTNGYFTHSGGNSALSFLGEGELILLDGSAFFVEVRARNVFYLRALEVSLDNIANTDGFIEATLKSYTWVSAPLKYRTAQVLVKNDPADVVTSVTIRMSLKKVYKGMPITKDNLESVEGYGITAYSPLSNLVVLDTLVVDGTYINFRVPYGEGDTFSFTELNSTSFVLNKGRKRASLEVDSNRGFYDLRLNKGLNTKSNLPSLGLYPALPTSPKTRALFSLKTSFKRTHGLNNTSVKLGKMMLNRSDRVQRVSDSSVTDYARGNALVIKGKVPLYAFGFFPDHIISLTLLSDGSEITDYKVSKGVLYLEGLDGVLVRLEAISTIPLSPNQSWNKGVETLSEGQVPFIDAHLLYFNATPANPLAHPSAEELMNNPEGRRIEEGAESGDSPRTIQTNRSEVTRGISGEEEFYSDDLTDVSVSGSPFNTPMPVLLDKERPYAPDLVLNSTSSLIGDSTRLPQSLGVVRDYLVVLSIQ